MRKEQLKEYCEAEFENIEAVLAELTSLMLAGKPEYSTPELAALAPSSTTVTTALKMF